MRFGHTHTFNDADIVDVQDKTYFRLYQSKHDGLRQIVYSIVYSCAFAATFGVESARQRRQLVAYLRGIWDDLTMRLERTY
jgi:hypothetical protein